MGMYGDYCMQLDEGLGFGRLRGQGFRSGAKAFGPRSVTA